MRRETVKLPDGGYQVDIVTDDGRVAERAVYDATGVLVTRSYSEAFLDPVTGAGGVDPLATPSQRLRTAARRPPGSTVPV
jgi:hypothetical protein